MSQLSWKKKFSKKTNRILEVPGEESMLNTWTQGKGRKSCSGMQCESVKINKRETSTGFGIPLRITFAIHKQQFKESLRKDIYSSLHFTQFIYLHAGNFMCLIHTVMVQCKSSAPLPWTDIPGSCIPTYRSPLVFVIQVITLKYFVIMSILS